MYVGILQFSMIYYFKMVKLTLEKNHEAFPQRVSSFINLSGSLKSLNMNWESLLNFKMQNNLFKEPIRDASQQNLFCFHKMMVYRALFF